MALGQQLFGKRGWGNYDQPQRPTVWSSYRLFNSEQGNSVVTFSYWSDLLKIGISGLKQLPNMDRPMIDKETEVAIFLPPVKAKILADEIRYFMKCERTNIGVTAGQSFICISNGDVYGFNAPIISIRKFNKDLTAIEGEMVYVTRNSYFYAVHNFDPEKVQGENDYDTYKMLDLDILATILETFYQAMTSAVAYSIIDRQSFQDNKMYTTIDKIAEKLGVGTATSYVESKSNNGNGLSGSSTTSFSKGSIDDL